jgi:hypothetical protein
VQDDQVEVATMHATAGPDVAQGAVDWKFDRREVSSDWMDASHVTWFDSLLDRFAVAIERGEHVGQEAREAFLCVQLINAAYASARADSLEQRLGLAEAAE